MPEGEIEYTYVRGKGWVAAYKASDFIFITGNEYKTLRAEIVQNPDGTYRYVIVNPEGIVSYTYSFTVA